MKSYQNLKILQNLYRLKAMGYNYVDPIDINENTQTLSINDPKNLQKEIATCHLCDFSKSRSQSMSGFGSLSAPVMFIDHVVSELEDETNSYFCGRSGEMLKNMIQNVLGFSIEDIFYTHTIKCKPLDIHSSYKSEWLSCSSYLFAQIEQIRPKVIVTLGEDAFSYLSSTPKEEFEKLRGHIIEFKKSKLIPIYHPSYILRNPNLKRIVYNDLKTIKSCL
ncbi:Uracil-DNA glycosylase, family 4 [hydrothermal vent metagenome]|uniref:Uracil-DNA glycosylase, family 4 n=1 Tax=hydrothermal vent metagenome TaxID=652676 RepID=A0A1W1C617_9ZZZZ